jgi:hypothetical protein
MASDGRLDAKSGRQLKVIIELGEGLPFTTFVSIGHRTAKFRVYLASPAVVFRPQSHFPPRSSILMAHAITPTCSHVCGQHVEIIKTPFLVADFGSTHQQISGESKFRGARIKVSPKIGIDPQTLIYTWDSSRDGPHLCTASPFTSPSTHVSVRLLNKLQ